MKIIATLERIIKKLGLQNFRLKRKHIRYILFFACLITLIITMSTMTYADNDYSVTLSMPKNDENSVSSTIQILIVLTVLSLAPAIVILLTSFTRIIVVLHFTRSALGTQTTPPNQVLIGLALFLTLFIMSPVFLKVNSEAIKPLNEGKITYEKAFEKGMEPVREFMFEQTRKKDIKLFADIAKIDTKENPVKELKDIPNTVLIPAFVISELRTGFIIGFLIYIPFIVVDMVVSSTLMSMGMMMLPPTVISLPFKILLFILADGWNLLIGNLVKTFY